MSLSWKFVCYCQKMFEKGQNNEDGVFVFASNSARRIHSVPTRLFKLLQLPDTPMTCGFLLTNKKSKWALGNTIKMGVVLF